MRDAVSEDLWRTEDGQTQAKSRAKSEKSTNCINFGYWLLLSLDLKVFVAEAAASFNFGYPFSALE